ncbi:2,3-diaminopropionate biosynthesis protein SbnA [Staphylospora marina]|uniref:2,3-diaminopropionate biosynthesis protein SbnA n=1 Tax=Staphylospora marina TaxID=2490858 RepID=UPI0024056907|nr:2,3-diaminopropionate biosynthesis protein SbnA [Staphylospora marina]
MSVSAEDMLRRTVPDSVVDCVGNTPMVRLNRLFGADGVEVYAKLEYMNPGGSMKDRTARHMILESLKDGTIRPGSHLIESSSGNLGIAIAMIARVYGLKFTCVIDPKTSPANVRILKKLGASVDLVTKKDEHGGYLHTRIRRVKEILREIPGSVWLNQYANERNWQAHYHGTGREMTEQLPGKPDVLVAAVSTSGSLLGCARRLRETWPGLKTVAVDVVGSVIFGGKPGRREIPGMGASRVPEILSREEIDEVIYVSDREAVQGCHDLLAREGIFAGGSSGAVVTAIRKLIPSLPKPCRIVTLFPDRGDRYLDLVYNDDWVEQLPKREEEK